MLVTSRFEDSTKSFFLCEILFNGPFSTAAKQYNQKVLVTSKSEDPFCPRKSSKLVHCVRVARNETKRLKMCQIYLMLWIVMSKRIPCHLEPLKQRRLLAFHWTMIWDTVWKPPRGFSDYFLVGIDADLTLELPA